MSEFINVVTVNLIKLAKNSAGLTSLMQTFAVILALLVIGLMVWKGKP